MMHRIDNSGPPLAEASGPHVADPDGKTCSRFGLHPALRRYVTQARTPSWSRVAVCAALAALTVYAGAACLQFWIGPDDAWDAYWPQPAVRAALLTLLLVAGAGLLLAGLQAQLRRSDPLRCDPKHRPHDGATAHWHLRITLYSLLIICAVHSALQAWQLRIAHAARQADAELLTQVPTHSQQALRMVALAQAEALARVDEPERVARRAEFQISLQRLEAGAESMRTRLRAFEPAPGTPDGPGAEALRTWDRATWRLWTHAQAWLHASEPAADRGAAMSATELGDAAWALAEAGLQLANWVAATGKLRDAEAREASERWIAITTLLVVILALTATEPTARSIRSQHRRLRAQAREMRQHALVAEHTSNAVAITDAHQQILWVNEAFTRQTGFTSAQASGQRLNRLLQSDDLVQAFLARLEVATTAGPGLRVQAPARTRDGSEVWFDLDIQALHDEEGAVTGFVHVATDITERRRDQMELRIAAIAFDSLEAIAITDAQQNILKVNSAFERITGYTASEAHGQQTGRLLKSGAHDAEFYAGMWRSLRRDKHWQGEIWNRRKNGEIYPQWLNITAIADEEGRITHYVAAFTDIAQEKRADEQIHRLAFYDPLTELPNRRLLNDRLTQAMAVSARSQRRGAILFIDLDHLKDLNDTKGHETGDLLLIEVARRLRVCVRASDTVARLGGDEFVVVLPELSSGVGDTVAQTEEQAIKLGEKLREALHQPYLLNGLNYQGSCSVGISLFMDHEVAVDELLKRADTAMYEAKTSGRNTVRLFDPNVYAAMESRIELENDLRQALPGGQLHLEYQAQVDRRGQIVGAEALLRWRHPTKGLVGPSQFIPLAEKTGLILSIGHWVLEAACAQLHAWAEQPATRHLHLAVNVSAQQFRQPDFVAQLWDVVTRAGIDPSRLELELTESLVVTNLEDTVPKMKATKAMGIRISIDDFGTGHSSLSYLTRLPLDQLKIDQSFVSNIGLSETDAAIVQTIIGMAQTLRLDVIAEGVETETQRRLLEQCGCFNYQGYLFGRPCLPAVFEAQLIAQSPLAPSPSPPPEHVSSDRAP